MPTVETKRFLQLAHDYQELETPTRWGQVQRRFNNRREIGDDLVAAVTAFRMTFGDRIGTPREHKFGRLFEGSYGYRWTDVGIEMVTVETSTTVETIEASMHEGADQ